MRSVSRRTIRLALLVALLAVVGLFLAACGSTPAPTATPEPEPLYVRVHADGSGEYGSLEATIETVPAGSTLVLDTDTYRLSGPLTITKALKLVGAGMDQTTILSEAGGYGLRFVGPGPFAAENITFRHEGEASADVIVVQGGEISFSYCRFSGALRAQEESARAGLRLLQHTSGEVRGCEAVENSSIGIWLADQAQVTLERNLCNDNELMGIAYQDDAGGLARQNACSGNKAAGIHVAGQAQPTLEDNRSLGNGSGIAYLDQAGGLARGNECSGNGFVGISVGNEAQPTLEANICNSNQYGLVYAGSQGGTARRNECSGNLVGLLVGEGADPVLQDNNCHDNDEENVRDLRP